MHGTGRVKMRSKLSFTTINVSILEKQENMMGTLLGKIGLQYQPNNEYTKKNKAEVLTHIHF